MEVYVLNKCGAPLMPTERCGWVAYALKHGEAKVVRREPFTIQLLRDSTRHLQAVTLGVDAGSRHIGLSATTEKKELYSAQVELRTDVSELLTARRESAIKPYPPFIPPELLPLHHSTVKRSIIWERELDRMPAQGVSESC